MVPRCQVRHLGALGTDFRHRHWRLVRPQHVHGRQPPVSIPSENLRPSLEVRIQGHHPAVEGRALRPEVPRAPLPPSRREVLSSAWASTATTSICGTPATAAGTAVKMGPKRDIVGRVAQGRARRGSPIRRQRARLGQLQLVGDQQGRRQAGPLRGHSLRWQRRRQSRSLFPTACSGARSLGRAGQRARGVEARVVPARAGSDRPAPARSLLRRWRHPFRPLGPQPGGALL